MFGLANYSFAALPDLAILRLVLGIFCRNLLLQAEFLLLCSGWPGCPDSVLLRACFSDCLGRTACLLNIDGTWQCVSKEAHLGPSEANVWRNQGAGREQCHVWDVILSDPAVLTLLEPWQCLGTLCWSVLMPAWPRAQFAFLNKHLGVAGIGEMGVFECLPFFRCWKGKRKIKCHDPWCQCWRQYKQHGGNAEGGLGSPACWMSLYQGLS